MRLPADNAASAAIAAAEEPITTIVAGPSTVIAVIAPTGPAAAAFMGASNATNFNSTASATSAASAAAASEAQFTSPLNTTNDPNMCHVNKTMTGDGHVANPFCKPTAGQVILANTEIEGEVPAAHTPKVADGQPLVTWDRSLFDANNTNEVWLVALSHSEGASTPKTLQNSSAPNSDGGLFFRMTSEWLGGEISVDISLHIQSVAFIGSANTGDANTGDSQDLSGPTITLQRTENTTSSSGSSSKKLGEEVGIPVGLVVLLVAILAIAGFFCIRKRRGQGYGGSGARKQRIAKVTTPVAGRGHRRDPSFHDEPTRGVELQDRNRVGDDNWDWGSPVSSPSSGDRGSNVFRDEIGRQRGGT